MKVKWILLTLLIAGVVLAEPNQIDVFRASGDEYCVRILNSSNQVFDHDNSNWNISGATDPNGYLDLTQDTNTPIHHYKSFPSAITTAGIYKIMIFDSNAADVNLANNYNGGEQVYWTGTELIAGKADIGYWLSTAVATPTVAGVPEVDMTYINGDSYVVTKALDTELTAGSISASLDDITGIDNGKLIEFYNESAYASHIAVIQSFVLSGDVAFYPAVPATYPVVGTTVKIYPLKFPTAMRTGDLSTQAKADVQAECDTSLATYDGPTDAEMQARTLVAANYATATNLQTVDDNVDAIVADTGELQTDLADGGRLDLLLDLILADTGTDGVKIDLTQTGITAGGTWTLADWFKNIGAEALGDWQDKTGESGTVEILDAEDDSTVILELTRSATTPYKQTTKQ